MVKHTQTISRQNPTNCLSVFDHFVGLVLTVLRNPADIKICTNVNQFNTFLVYGFILNPLKTPENIWFLVFSEGYRMRALIRNKSDV